MHFFFEVWRKEAILEHEGALFNGVKPLTNELLIVVIRARAFTS